MFKFTKLNDWCLTGTKPAFYDTESATAIEQTAKLYGAVKTLIDETEKAINSLNETVELYKTGVINDFECFKDEITKIAHDYIETIDLKIAHQDRVIEENITYIKENLASEVERVVNDMKESGELADVIGDSLDGLTTSVNELNSKVTALENDNIINKSKIEGLENQTIQFLYNEQTESLNIVLGGVN